MINTNSNESPIFKLFGKTIATTTDKEPDDVAMAETITSEAIPENSKTKGAHLPCPRCKSKDTKFCYFNNYNVNQPRHFCRACHRYWTAGGSLRNVPVGAGRRKNRVLSTVPIPNLSSVNVQKYR